MYLVYHFRTKLLTVTLFFAHLCARKVLAEIYFSNIWSLVTQLLQTARAAGRNIVRVVSIWISWKYFVERQLDLNDILWIHISIREKVFHGEKKKPHDLLSSPLNVCGSVTKLKAAIAIGGELKL